jgi:putative addiction module component (TIGR02574 family)
MNASLKNIRTTALKLKEEERIKLIEALLDSMEDGDVILYKEEWLNVVKERKMRYEKGKSGSTSWEEIKKNLPFRVSNPK